MSGVPSFWSSWCRCRHLSSCPCLRGDGRCSGRSTPAWRYDLHPGDHLIYRYTFQRRTQSDEEQIQVEARFRTHVLVAAENAGRISLGFQRNREAAELTEYRSKGKDRLAREQPAFQKRMQVASLALFRSDGDFAQRRTALLLGNSARNLQPYPRRFARSDESAAHPGGQGRGLAEPHSAGNWIFAGSMTNPFTASCAITSKGLCLTNRSS